MLVLPVSDCIDVELSITVWVGKILNQFTENRSYPFIRQSNCCNKAVVFNQKFMMEPMIPGEETDQVTIGGIDIVGHCAGHTLMLCPLQAVLCNNIRCKILSFNLHQQRHEDLHALSVIQLV